MIEDSTSAEHRIGRAPSDGRYLRARLHSGLASRFRTQRCFDPKSDGSVPLALFAGTVTTSRAALSQDIPLVIALCVAIIGLYGAVFLLSRIVLRFPTSISAL